MSNTFNDNNNEDNASNIAEGEDKYYDENYSMNVTYEDFDFPNRARDNEISPTTNPEANIGHILNSRAVNGNLNPGNVNSNSTMNTNVNLVHPTNIIVSNQVSSNGILPQRENSLNEISNFNLNAYNDANNNNNNNYIDANSDDDYMNRNFETSLDEIFDNLTYLITSEKNKIKNEKTNIHKARQKFIEYKTQELLKLEKEKEIWKENLKIAEKMKVKESDILDLDIGGTHLITTTRSTLMKYPNSALAAMFSGRHELTKHNSRLFIDRDGLAFMNMVNYLRNGKFPIFKDKNEEINFFEELEFWQIPNYEGTEGVLKNVLQFDSEWCASTLSIESNNTLIKKHNLQHGIVFCKTPLDVFCPYIEFKVIMNIPCRGKSHMFIGLVDKSKYKYEHLISTFWKDSPSSYYWDAWNTKLIKTDENGVQVGSVSGYGCQCEEYETRLSIKYDHKARAVSFYKNNVNLGVAFRNVPSGLTPSLDIWFESGTVEIMKNSSWQEKIYL